MKSMIKMNRNTCEFIKSNKSAYIRTMLENSFSKIASFTNIISVFAQFAFNYINTFFNITITKSKNIKPFKLTKCLKDERKQTLKLKSLHLEK